MDKVEQFPQDDWHDQDLLTRDEAAERLEEEIATTEAILANIKPEDGEHAELAKRLETMRSILRDYQGSP